MPNIECLFEKLGRAVYFSTIDLAKGFHQIKMDENDIEKTAFSSAQGHFEYVRMPFGLKNAPATFQRMMNVVLQEHINKICILYMDDILIFSTSLREHMENLEKIFNTLIKHNLKVQFSKCKFLSKHTTFLGHDITCEGIKPNKDKIKAILNVPIPKTVKEIQSFLGLSGYYRKFIKNYSMIAAPIIKYLKKDVKLNIKDNTYIEAFHKLKQILTSGPLLAFPDFSKNYVVTTDASDLAIGAVLSQVGRPISYVSRGLNAHEKRYHTLEKELLAIMWALKQFRPYLFGRQFTVRTDHQPLKWLFTLKEPNQRIIRWRTLISEFEFNIEYIKGNDNKVADFLSRLKNDNKNEIDYDIKSLFENSIDTVHSAVENQNDHFLISESIINKYLTQIRILKNKNLEYEKLYNKYKIIYLAETDLENSSYLTDIFRKHIRKGKVGIYSELSFSKYNIIQQKLINLFSNDTQISFTKCKYLAHDIQNKEELYNIIENIHKNGNHRGIFDNFEKMKLIYFYPKLKIHINKYINSCDVCNEHKYDRKPFKKFFNHTETPNEPNEIVHMDIFKILNTNFLSTIDRFTKLGSMHKLQDKNMCTVRTKLEERFSYLGIPKKLIMDNEFNNALIKMFCREKNINTHFTTPNSHTGNADVERFHSTILEHIRILNTTQINENVEELVSKAVGFYNDSIHSTTKIKPFDFLNNIHINFEQVKRNIIKEKRMAINRINSYREKIPEYHKTPLYIKNGQAARNKILKRYNKYNKNNPNKVDIAYVKRPLKCFPNI